MCLAKFDILRSNVLNNKFVVDINSLLSEYTQLDSFFRSAIIKIFSEENDTVDINVSEMINDNGTNHLKMIDNLNEKVGLYFFIGDDNKIKYIGKGGTSRSSAKDAKGLRYRISQEICEYKGNNQNTLSKNIIDIDSVLLNKNMSSSESINVIKAMKLRVFDAGYRIENEKVNIDLIERVESLEMILISLLPSRYNK
jgi:hypothetical protein